MPHSTIPLLQAAPSARLPRRACLALLCASALGMPLAHAQSQPARPPGGVLVKPAISDNLRMSVYADN